MEESLKGKQADRVAEGDGASRSLHLLSDPEELSPWEQVRPRHIAPDQWAKFEGYVSEIFEAFGMNLDTPGTIELPSASSRRSSIQRPGTRVIRSF